MPARRNSLRGLFAGGEASLGTAGPHSSFLQLPSLTPAHLWPLPGGTCRGANHDPVTAPKRQRRHPEAHSGLMTGLREKLPTTCRLLAAEPAFGLAQSQDAAPEVAGSCGALGVAIPSKYKVRHKDFMG